MTDPKATRRQALADLLRDMAELQKRSFEMDREKQALMESSAVALERYRAAQERRRRRRWFC